MQHSILKFNGHQFPNRAHYNMLRFFYDVGTWFLIVSLMEIVRQSFSSSAILAGRSNTGMVL
jgi:hypothetical protein